MSVLHIEIDTDSDSFERILAYTKLPIYQVFRKGDKIGKKKKTTFERNIISCGISDKEFDDFEGQIEDIYSFLEEYHIELKSLQDNFNVTDWFIDLPYSCRLSDEKVSQNDYIPSELIVELARLKIGLSLSHYKTEPE